MPLDYPGLARAAEARGDVEQAGALWEEAVRAEPPDDAAFAGLTDYLVRAGQHERALGVCAAAAARTPSRALPHLRAGRILYQQIGDVAGARSHFSLALACEPDNSSAHEHLARIHLDQFEPQLSRGHAELALKRADQASALRIGFTYLNDHEGVIALAIQILANNPVDVEALVLCARAFYMLGRYTESLGMFARAALHSPRRADALFGLGECLMLLGDRESAWRRFDDLVNEDMLARIDIGVRPSAGTFWRGQPLAGKSVFVAHFLGVGDNIMMARYVRSLNERGARVSFCCRPELFRLLENLQGVDELSCDWRSRPWNTYDYWTFDFLLPRHLGGPESVTGFGDGGYVAVPGPPGVRRLPARSDRLRVGLCWSSGPAHFTGLARFLTPEDLRPLADLPDIDWFVVQKGPANAGFAARSGLAAADFSEEWADFRDTAAFMEELDLVVSICSGPLNVAGALGRPAWGLICAAPDWRWGATGATSPWYPGVRLFRQSRLYDWGPVVAELKSALAAYQRPSTGSK